MSPAKDDVHSSNFMYVEFVFWIPNEFYYHAAVSITMITE